MADKLVISIDSSTTACKAIAWNRQGKVRAEGRASYPLLQPEPTWHEQNAEHWWEGACNALRECISQIDVGQVDALGITHQRESFVPVDNEGQPIRHGILWSDERSRAQVVFLEKTYGRDELHRLTGKPPSMTPSLPKIVWLLQNEPATIRQAYRILDVHAFLVYKLTRMFRTSYASADPMGLVDMASHRWASELIEDLGLRLDQFPELIAPGTIIGHVSAEAARVTGLPSGLPVVAGAGDGQCAGLGANTTSKGQSYLNLGTAVVSGAISSEYVTDLAFRTLYAPIPDRYFLETVLRGGVFTVGWFVDKFASELRDSWLPLSPEEILETAARKIGPGSDGLMLVPYWNNVMNPYWDPAASGITIGWTGSHGREHFYRAILEGIAFEQRLVGDAVMEAVGERFQKYVTMGGGSRSALWCQIVADITNVPVARSATTEATCLGAAVLAAAAVGWYPNVVSAADAMTGTADQFQPDATNVSTYDRLYRDIYKPLFPTLRPLVDRLTELTQGSGVSESHESTDLSGNW